MTMTEPKKQFYVVWFDGCELFDRFFSKSEDAYDYAQSLESKGNRARVIETYCSITNFVLFDELDRQASAAEWLRAKMYALDCERMKNQEEIGRLNEALYEISRKELLHLNSISLVDDYYDVLRIASEALRGRECSVGHRKSIKQRITRFLIGQKRIDRIVEKRLER